MNLRTFKLIAASSSLVLLGACTSQGLIENAPLTAEARNGYSLRNSNNSRQTAGDTSFFLAFSGGGTRAAALSYGVMQELRDTGLLDEVDVISSVSGGSFTAAYYGLYGERIFEDFEEAFLRRDVQGKLFRSFFNPFRAVGYWVSGRSRDEMAIDYYNKILFHDATFADLGRRQGPTIVINASDLGYGVRFSFVQEYFNLLCSDISTFSIARAVAASSAVPVLFQPIVVKNYGDCPMPESPWIEAAKQRAEEDPELLPLAEQLATYQDKQRRQYVHLIDGGITDNLGLRTMYDVVEIAGGARQAVEFMGRKVPRRNLVILSVDATTHAKPELDKSNNLPSLGETVHWVTKTQLRRYNEATLELMYESVQRWSEELSTPQRRINPFFIHLNLAEAASGEEGEYLNQIPTSFSLTDEQVDRLIDTGRRLLREHPEFQRLQQQLGGSKRGCPF